MTTNQGFSGIGTQSPPILTLHLLISGVLLSGVQLSMEFAIIFHLVFMLYLHMRSLRSFTDISSLILPKTSLR